jgi:organic hydroperoxide reductase OsmC/OhrA
MIYVSEMADQSKWRAGQFLADGSASTPSEGIHSMPAAASDEPAWDTPLGEFPESAFTRDAFSGCFDFALQILLGSSGIEALRST